jgi:hypothetical protein
MASLPTLTTQAVPATRPIHGPGSIPNSGPVGDLVTRYRCHEGILRKGRYVKQYNSVLDHSPGGRGPGIWDGSRSSGADRQDLFRGIPNPVPGQPGHRSQKDEPLIEGNKGIVSHRGID